MHHIIKPGYNITPYSTSYLNNYTRIIIIQRHTHLIGANAVYLSDFTILLLQKTHDLQLNVSLKSCNKIIDFYRPNPAQKERTVKGQNRLRKL